MKWLVLILALSMPLVGWLSNTGQLGPTNGEISDRYPTLIMAAGYAFSIWGPIFLLDALYAAGQLRTARQDLPLQRIRQLTAAAFALTSLWMVVFAQQWFWLSLVVIWLSLGCLLGALRLASAGPGRVRGPWWMWLPLSLHAGWVSLAVFLNTAQVAVAFELVSTQVMLPWTLVLYALAAALLLGMLVLLRGNPWYALAALWGLAGVYVRQQASPLPGAQTSALIALSLAVLVVLAALGLGIRYRRGGRGPLPQ